MKRINLFHILLVVLFIACGPLTRLTPTLVSNLPDLAITSAYVSMVDNNGYCLPDYAFIVMVVNQGSVSTQDVVLVETNTGQQFTVGLMGAYQSVTLTFDANATTNIYTVVADPQNLIVESNENNNSATFHEATATPPIQCPYAQPGDPTPTPIPVLPPTPSASLSLVGLIYSNMDTAQITRIVSGGQSQVILQGISARFSLDGISALFETAGEIFLAEPMDNPGINLTKTADRWEVAPQWLGQNPSQIVINSIGVNETQEKGWNKDILGYLSMMNMDGSDYVGLSDVPSYTMAALSLDGQTIAYDEMGMPMLYEMGKGAHPFDPTLYGYQPATGAKFINPSFSTLGRWLTWWIAETSSGSEKRFSLVLFDLQGKTSTILHVYSAPPGTLGWLSSPIWNGNENWIAYQTRDEFTTWDLWISHPDGNYAYRLGLATDPVWSPDQIHLAYVQSPPRSDPFQTASLSIIEVASWNVQSANLPSGSIPLAWILPASMNSPYFPMFTAPAGWLTYINPNPAYKIQYPPDVKFEANPEKLIVSLLPPSSQLTEKSITIETRTDTIDNCYAASPWNGKTQTNGVDLKYYGGKDWETTSDGTRFLAGNYATYRNGYCYLIQSRITIPNGALPTRAEMDSEILLNIISTLVIP